jgi:hypothetical protein
VAVSGESDIHQKNRFEAPSFYDGFTVRHELKQAGTVTTAWVTFSPRYLLESSASLRRT